MNKKIISLFLIVLCLLSLSCCDSTNTGNNSGEEKTTQESSPIDLLNGSWYAKAIMMKKKLYELDELPVISGMYENNFLTIDSEDKTFAGYYIMLINGRCEFYYTDDEGNNSYLFYEEEAFTYNTSGEKPEKEYSTNEKKPIYIVTLIKSDMNTLALAPFDPISGTAVFDAIPIYYVREDCESEFIAKYKTTLDTDNVTTTKSYFSNKYGTSTTKCAHSGCNNYIASSGDTNCCTTHSNKCLNCKKYIDEDAMYCMDCISSSLSTTTSTTQSYFSNKYGTSTTKCAHSGCNNYIASSGDTNCCTTHSNKCLNCGKYIDEDAMYCMDCIIG